jgi:hypothetical protein
MPKFLLIGLCEPPDASAQAAFELLAAYDGPGSES